MIYFEDLEVGTETYFGSYEVTREEVVAAIRRHIHPEQLVMTAAGTFPHPPRG